MSLIQPLPSGPLDIVGDIHGEIGALQALLQHLGYDAQGHHSQGRHLVFVGDLCDRGPDSPAVLACVQALVEQGCASAVLGNHEINLLREDVKDGSGWFFDGYLERDRRKYPAFNRPDPAARARIPAFLSGLPMALEREDLRVVHAAWIAPAIAQARSVPLGDATAAYDRWEDQAEAEALRLRIAQRKQQERSQWPHDLTDPDRTPPFLRAHGESELNKQMFNPLKVMTCGVERLGTLPFYAGGKWRFVERSPWWEHYTDAQAVVVGHYWRKPPLPIGALARKPTAQDLFAGIDPLSWHGQRGNVFCIDYSVGARWDARRRGIDAGERQKLAALRWPERIVVFDDGQELPSQGFGVPQVVQQAA